MYWRWMEKIVLAILVKNELQKDGGNEHPTYNKTN